MNRKPLNEVAPMLRRVSIALIMLTMVSVRAKADSTPGTVKLTAAQIVERNVAARGGLQAWRRVQTLSMAGKVGAGGDQRAIGHIPLPDKRTGKALASQRLAEEAQLPFVMKLQRPRKVRLEVQFKGQTAVQVYDGVTGWKRRPYLNRNDVESYSAEELKAASLQPDLDGLLIDYAAKGNTVELVDTEKVEDRDAYNLKVTTKNGYTTHMWIDAKTFLEAKIEGQPRRLDGIDHPVEVYYRDFREVNGLQIPFVLETRVLPVSKPGSPARDSTPVVEKIVIESVQVNPSFDRTLFSRPQVETALNIH
jgi:hypothetical protein